MKKKILLLSAAVALVLFLGFRTRGFRSLQTVYGNWEFTGAIDADSVDTDHLTVNTGAFFGGTVDIDDGNLLVTDGQRIIITDDSEGDSISIFDIGTVAYIAHDNALRFSKGGTVDLNYDGNLYHSSDTTYRCGISNKRWKELWGLRLYWTDGAGTDSGKVYDDGTNTVVETDNEVKFTNSVMFGGAGVAIDSATVSNDTLLFWVDGTAYGAKAQP